MTNNQIFILLLVIIVGIILIIIVVFKGDSSSYTLEDYEESGQIPYKEKVIYGYLKGIEITDKNINTLTYKQKKKLLKQQIKDDIEHLS